MGTGGTKQSSGTRVGPIFAQQGYIVLAFDYREPSAAIASA